MIKQMRMYLLILAAVAAACSGCAGTQVIYRVSFEYDGQTVGIKMRNSEVELSADLTR